MWRIRHTLPALLLFRTMTPAFSAQYIRLSRPFLCASLRLASCLFMLHGTSPYTLSSIIIHFLPFHNTHSFFFKYAPFLFIIRILPFHLKPYSRSFYAMLPYIISPACIFLCLYRCLPLPFPISSFYSANAFLIPFQCLSLPLPISSFAPTDVFRKAKKCLFSLLFRN